MTNDFLVRAMAKTLVDHGTNLNSDRAIIMQLVHSGFPIKAINKLWDRFVTMALMRKYNEERKAL